MELVPAYGGQIPPGRRPVVGGQEIHNGAPQLLYHALAVVDGVRVPGKAGLHLVRFISLWIVLCCLLMAGGWWQNGANVAYGSSEVYAKEYELL